MPEILKRAFRIIAVIIFLITIIFYIEGFIFYSFSGNLGFLLSVFAAPFGLLLGLLGGRDNVPAKIFGIYGNAIAIIFTMLYWPVGYLIEWIGTAVF